ncbi:hypothetical protein QWA_17875, partial [Alcaligenes faecalis subsp. faecalis NCIB 8687]
MGKDTVFFRLILGLLASTGTVMAQGHDGHGHGKPEPVRALSTQVHASQCWVRLLPKPTPSAATLSPDLEVYMPSGPDHWVRPGICLYGDGTVGGHYRTATEQQIGMAQIML